MDLNKIPLFAALTRRMDWLTERQRVLATNIANSDTPGYKPRDLKPQSFASLVAGTDNGGLHVATSSPMHLANLHADGGTATVANAPKGGYESSPTGNGISLEQQLMQVADTQLDHQTMANLYRKHIALLKSAIGAKSA